MMKFTKMHGCGNDYVYINCLEDKADDPAELARRVSDRHFGHRFRRADPDLSFRSGGCAHAHVQCGRFGG